MADNLETYSFIERLLSDPRVILSDGTVVTEEKGTMAGVPISSFLANIYLNQLDWHFFLEGKRYARYSDDIIVFARSAEERQESVSTFIIISQRCHLQSIMTKNHDKESMANPHERWEFLGISYCEGKFDISENSANKLKKKMWRKSRALLRWKDKKNLENIKAAKAFAKSFNRKFYDNPIMTELTWTRWYFPIINTTETLRAIDHYMQDCIRYIGTEKRTKKRFSFDYCMMRALGYKSLVHHYYEIRNASIQQDNPT